MAATQAPLAATGRKAAKNSPPAGDRALFAQWVREEYLGQLRATPAEGGAKYRRFLEEAEREDHRALSGVRRVQSFNVLKYGYPMRPSGYTAAVLVARMAVGKDQIVRTHYAQTYWRPGEALPEYISVSPTYDSRDGEYRGNFLWYPAFAGAYGEQAEALAEVEGMVLEAVQLGDLDLDIEVFPAETYSATANKIRDARIGVAALVVAYALDAARIAAGHQQVHTSRGYVDIMARLHARGAAARGPSPSGGDLSAFEVGRSAARDRAKCGAKLLPLTLRAAASPGDINHHPWREIYIARLCGDLVVNAVAPMFPTFNSWSYIEGADRALFENAQVRRLYDRGEQAESVVAA